MGTVRSDFEWHRSSDGMWLQVVAALKGEEDLPWEGEMSEDVIRKLGAMHDTILAMLHREPDMRPSMKEIHSAIVNMERT